MLFRRSLLRRLVLLSILAVAPWAGPAAADAPQGTVQPWQPPFKDDTAGLAAAAAAFPPAEQGVRVLLEEVEVVFDEQHRRTHRRRLIYRVDSAAAVEGWGQVAANWRPWFQERPELRARVIAADGRVRVLDPGTVVESPSNQASPNVLSDAMTLRAPLPGLAIGAVVEEEVTTRESVPYFAAGVGGDYVFGNRVPTASSRLVLDAPRSLPLAWRAFSLPDGVEAVEELSGDRRRVTFESGPIEALDPLPYTLPGDVRGWSQVVYSTGRSWEELGAAYAAVVDRQIEGADLADVVARLAPPELDRQARIDALTAWVHEEVRYTGVELGEAALVPRRPDEVLARGYGDCKDKAALLVALLRQAGIPSHLALLAAGAGADVVPELPGLGGFDHAIVHVAAGPQGEPEVWIDATAPAYPPGLLPREDLGRRALLASARGAALVPTPEARAEDDRRVVRREMRLAEFGNGTVVEVREYHGRDAARMRSFLETADAESRERHLRDSVLETYKDAELTAWSVEGEDDLSAPLVVRLEIAPDGGIVTDWAAAAVWMYETEVLLHLPSGLYPQEEAEAAEELGGGAAEVTADEPGLRWDMEQSRPRVYEIHGRIVPPAGFHAVDLPPGGEQSIGPASFRRSFEAEEDGAVRFHLLLDTGGARVPAMQVEAARSTMRVLLDEEEPVEVRFIEAVEELRNAGRLPEAVREARRLAVAHPDHGMRRVRLAMTLLAGGLGEAARTEARAAAETAPDSAPVHAYLGYVLLHDQVGRPLVEGWDRAGAVAALRRARDLDPEQSLFRRNLAVVLERNEEALQFGEGADLEEALVEHRHLVDEMGETATLVNLIGILERQGLWEEAERRLRAQEALGAEAQSHLLVVVAAQRGVEAALRETLDWPSEGRRAVLQTAGGELMRLRRYGDSADFVTAAAQGAPDSAQALGLAAVLRRMRRHEELELDTEDPVSIFRHAMRVIVADDPEERAAFADRVPGPGATPGGDSGLDMIAAAVAEAVRSVGVPSESLVDFVLAACELDPRRADGVGVRVRATGPFGAAPLDLYLAERDGRLHWLTLGMGGLVPPELGTEALRRLREGDLAAARVWLDWAREMAVEPGFVDPLSGHPLALSWRFGQEASEEEARLAAAALAAGGESGAEEAAAVLEAAAEDAEGEREHLRIDAALIWAYREMERPEDVLAAAERVADAYPDSDLAQLSIFGALFELERFEELERRIARYLERRPDNAFVLGMAAELRLRNGDLSGYRSGMERASRVEGAGAGFANNLAWLDVVEERVDETSIQLAHRSVEEDGDESGLHTLATLYAELDRPVQARDVLHQLVTFRDGSLETHDWYVVGRMAESYGELESARAAYRRVEPPGESEEPSMISTWSLAQRRLAALSPEPSMESRRSAAGGD